MSDLKEAYTHYRQLRQVLSQWLDHSAFVDHPGRNGGGEDEANYALSWFPHYLVTAEDKVQARFQSLLGDLENWVQTDCYHGYEPVAEAHHGTEPFLLFLPRYQAMFPEDETAAKLIEDAAHHIGNWVEEIPPWYDYDRDCFHSYRIGTREVGGDDQYALELAEHYRFIHIALAAHRAGGDGKYLDWSLRYGRKRAERILNYGDGPMPVVWEAGGAGVSARRMASSGQRDMSSSHHHVPDDPLAGIENLLASGAIYAFGDLYRLSSDEVFLNAARKIAEPLVGELLDPFADPGAAAVSYYRWTFQDTSLDDQIRSIVGQMPPEPDAPLAMVFPQEHRRREPGVGKRADMIYWGLWSEDGSVRPCREPSTAASVLGYQVTGDVHFACRALRFAATKLMMARRVLRGGREHADMGGAICSVAAGHGRNWGQGAVTGCYGPLLLGTREIQSRVAPLIQVRDGDGASRLPEEVLSLVIPGIDGAGQALFYNGGEQTISFAWCEADDGGPEWQKVELAPDQTQTFELSI